MGSTSLILRHILFLTCVNGHTVAVKKKLTFRSPCNDGRTMRIVLKKRLLNEILHGVLRYVRWCGAERYGRVQRSQSF